MAKEKRSNKWAFLLYQESAPENYLEILEEMHVPFVLSPWHDKDVNRKQVSLRSRINMALCSLTHLKAIRKSQNF